MKMFYKNKFKTIVNNILSINKNFLVDLEKIIHEASNKKKKIIICGNGGSASTASHVAVDLTKNAGITAINFNEANLITCFANDFGYKNWLKKSIEYYADRGDVLILISCSGNSLNLVNAAKFAIKNGISVVTLTGCHKKNKLNMLSTKINFWVNSKDYNVIEIIHHMMLLFLVDGIIYSKKLK